MMNKSILAREYARKHVEYWRRVNSEELKAGRDAFDLDHMLTVCFKSGFESGQRHQKKLEKAKTLQIK